jgi:formate-dependent nitrite reductase membrane component NrfD
MIDFFKKLPQTTRYPVGIEWSIFKQMPLIFGVGTLFILSPVVVIYLQNTVISATQYKTIYVCLGALFSYWFFVGVLAIGCVIVMMMKGPGYVADAYELPTEDKRLEESMQ